MSLVACLFMNLTQSSKHPDSTPREARSERVSLASGSLQPSSRVLGTARDTSLTYVVFELSEAGTLMCSGCHYGPQDE